MVNFPENVRCTIQDDKRVNKQPSSTSVLPGWGAPSRQTIQRVDVFIWVNTFLSDQVKHFVIKQPSRLR